MLWSCSLVLSVVLCSVVSCSVLFSCVVLVVLVV